MKNLMFFAIFAVAAAAAPAYAKPWQETCAEASKSAESIMVRRQQGASLKDTMAVFETIRESHPDGYKTIVKIVLSAYDSPFYETEENKQRAITEFGDEYYLTCAQEFQKVFDNIDRIIEEAVIDNS